VRCTI